jgi:predicted ATPase
LRSLVFLQQAKLRRDKLLVRGSALAPWGTGPAYSCIGVFIASWLLGDRVGQASAVETLSSIVAKGRFPICTAHSTIYSGWLTIEAGNPERGCQLIREGLAAVDSFGARHFHQFFLSLLADGQLRSGNIDDAPATLDRAEALSRSGQKIV